MAERIWTDLEIISNYRQAADKKKQIGITAEVCDMSKTEVVDLLLANGEEVPAQVKGGVKGGRSTSPKKKHTAPVPSPVPPPPRNAVTIDGPVLRYLRMLAKKMTNGPEAERLDMRDRIAELVAFLVLEDVR